MNNHLSKPSLLTTMHRHTVDKILGAWNNITGTARAITGTINPDLPNPDKKRVLAKMHECLDGKGGEVTARRNAIELGKMYLTLSKQGKIKFLKLLANEFDIHHQQVTKLAERFLQEENPAKRIDIELELRQALETPRKKILRQFIALPEGLEFLVDMRKDILAERKSDPVLAALETDLRSILAAWFDVGLLDLKEITWDSPAALLEKLIAYEAVHAIRSWNDLKNRLDSDRKCFAFFHHKMPTEPLIFVEVALVDDIADNIQHLLDEDAPNTDPHTAKTAVFYSISNTQHGLAGISLGNFLIKRVVDQLVKEHSNLKSFATLSPIPKFRAWLDPIFKAGNETLFYSKELRKLRKLIPTQPNAALAIYELLNQEEWYLQADMVEVVQPILTRLCAHYLVLEKHKDKAYDPVANFHLSNGARLERINWLADTSNKGLAQSAGFMVNYVYDLSDIDTNHEMYSKGDAIAVSKSVKQLAIK